MGSINNSVGDIFKENNQHYILILLFENHHNLKFWHCKIVTMQNKWERTIGNSII